MREIELKYGCNPNQKPARIFAEELPIEVLNGKPGYINFMDAFNGWQLVKEMKQVVGLSAAASFKHISPAGAAIGIPLDDTMKKICGVENAGELTALASAYARARGSDRMSSYGDFAALSDTCDVCTAKILSGLVSDGIIAPDYEPEALEILKKKRRGSYSVIKVNPSYSAPAVERREIFGVTFEQNRNEIKTDESLLSNIVTENKNIPPTAKRDLVIALTTLKYTQSNSVVYAYGGQAIGIGAGQQSRIHCTRLAGQKADNWYLRQSPEVLSLKFRQDLSAAEKDNATDVFLSDDAGDLFNNWSDYFTEKPIPFTREEKRVRLDKFTGVSLGSDAFFPFGDNIERAVKSGVSYIAQPGGSIRDDNVIETCNKYNIAMSFTGTRLFHH